MAVLDCFKSSPEKRLKVAGIVNETGLPRRTVQYALQTLTKNEFIQKLGQGAGTDDFNSIGVNADLDINKARPVAVARAF
jgi:hypothetical protein